MKSERDATKLKVGILERRVDDLMRSLESQVRITVQLRADHDLSLARLADAVAPDGETTTLSAILASLEPERPE